MNECDWRTLLGVGAERAGDNGPTETGTIGFGGGEGAGAPTPTGSDFGFTRMLEGGAAHDAWGAQRPSIGGAELTAALQQRRQSMAAAAAAENNRRRMTLGVNAVQGLAHPADRRKSRAPFNMPDGVADGETMTVDLDNRGLKVLGNDTFEFVYGGAGDATGDVTGATSAFGGGGVGGAGAPTPTLTDLSFGGATGLGMMHENAATAAGAGSGATTNVTDGVAIDLNLSDSFEVPPGADAAAASVAQHGLTPARVDASAASVAATTPHTTDTWDKPLTETTGQGAVYSHSRTFSRST